VIPKLFRHKIQTLRDLQIVVCLLHCTLSVFLIFNSKISWF
jgi:hypothetical protein